VEVRNNNRLIRVVRRCNEVVAQRLSHVLVNDSVVAVEDRVFFRHYVIRETYMPCSKQYKRVTGPRPRLQAKARVVQQISEIKAAV